MIKSSCMDFLRFTVLIAVVCVTSYAISQQDPCNLKQTCSDCIQEPKCFWCSDPLLNGTEQRCSQKTMNCNENYIMDPVTTYKEIRKKPLVSYTNNVSEVIQIVPQEVQLSMRINEPFNISVKYACAENPLDLYYLMDLSFSMKDDKNTLENLGRNLEVRMKNFTSDFRLGFGSFVDKIVRPYTNTLPSKMKAPCEPCAAPYGFHNHMKLSENVTHFLHEVRGANVSGNVDAPEGGLDALMQTVVCSEKIGWRKKALRLLVFSTDNDFHMAGDGKLGGIIEPNDGKCHLDTVGMYTHSSLQDYPSVSHLSHKVRDNAINVIFAVTDSQQEAYRLLAKNIEGAKVGLLTANSSNILELVEEQYKEILSSVEMQHDAPEYIQVKYYTSCQNSSKAIGQSNKCDELKIGKEVEFQVEIKVLSCPENPSNWNQTIRIFPVGSQEAIIVHLEMKCDCSCEHESIENAPQCSSNGKYACGICACNRKHFGKKCQCSSSEPLSAGTEIPSDCKPSTDPNIHDCSGHGNCICGVCQCKEPYYGKYCECDDFTCKQENDELCAGHGTCKCGKCQCEADWTGEACNCLVSTEKCKADDRNALCSGHGYCKCGACHCNEDYMGEYCEDQIVQVAQVSKCEDLFPCVLCQVHKRGPLTQELCASNCTAVIIEEADAIEKNTTDGINCVEYYDNCRAEYQYMNNDTSVIVTKALRNLECHGLVMGYYYILIISLPILFIGICLLILWKWITVIKDRLEYIKFRNEQERAMHGLSASPIYKSPVSIFKNPTYTGSF